VIAQYAVSNDSRSNLKRSLGGAITSVEAKLVIAVTVRHLRGMLKQS